MCLGVDTRRRRRRNGPHAAEAPGDVRFTQGGCGGERHGSSPSLSAGPSWQAGRAGHERQRMRHKGISVSAAADESISLQSLY